MLLRCPCPEPPLCLKRRAEQCFSRLKQGEERLTIALSCYPSFIDLAHGGHRPPRSGGAPYYFEQCRRDGLYGVQRKSAQVSWLHLRFAAAEASVPGRDRIAGKSRIQKKAPPEAGPFSFSRKRGLRGGLVHAAHAAHATHAVRHGRSVLLGFGLFGDGAFGGQQQGGHGSGVQQGGTGHLLGVDDAGLDEVFVFAGSGVVRRRQRA